jgi:mono/diheme cytochrome c family protein
MTSLRTICALAVVGIACLGRAAESTPDAAPSADAPNVDFLRDVQPLLAKHCFACHGPDEAESGLSFSNREAAFAETDSGEHAIVAGDIEASTLVARIKSADEGDRMPPEGDRLSEAEVELLTRWISQGAEWKKHWAFEPMKRSNPPTAADPKWNQNPIDAFVFDSLAAAKLKPNPPADRATLIRRAYYDLTGLPPTAAEVKAFVEDPDPDAFGRLIDQLLESPHYGERWGRHWLDLVRYAETNSYERDGAKPNAWKYRDYVIKSFNDDKPYDQFVREQLAGDELDNVTTESLTATGYYRLGIWDDEPVDALQAMYDGLDDVIMTTGQAFLGLTLNCARCHDHKIDPIPQKDYYSFLSFMADLTPYGNRGDQRTFSQIDVSSPDLNRRYAENDADKRRLEKQIHELEQIGIKQMSAPDQRATEGPRRERERVLKEKLKDHLGEQDWESYRDLKGQLADTIKAGKELPPRETVMGLAGYRKIDKPTHVLFRGNPHSPADEVRPAFPSIFELPAPDVPAVKDQPGPAGRRRILADWIASPDNRLTARVMANRLWQFHFGRGIVRSSNNFGQLGIPPTHPELLDWLAFQLIDNGWKLKSMHRLIMTSQAYQMSSGSQEEGLAADPDNDLFWRFDARRLSAEEVRDSLLAVNGSLNTRLYGPSIYPQLSPEVLHGQSRPGSGWGNSSPEDRNRRSIYIHVKRSLLEPLLSAFDFPDPDSTCEARFMTLQPGQSLALLNSDWVHQQAQRLADSIGAADLSNEDIVKQSVPAVLSREATSEEIADGDQLIKDLQTKHQLDRARAVQLYCLSVMNWNEFLFVD